MARSIRLGTFARTSTSTPMSGPRALMQGGPAGSAISTSVVVRENTEGFYADRNMEQGNGEMLVTPDVVISLRRITRLCCERIAHAACRLAMKRRRHLTIVHKANVLKIGDGMFLDICREAAKGYPGLAVDDILVDAMMAHVVRNPDRFDVIVATNMFGDILSDLTAELSGSLGLGGSLNVGDRFAMAQAAHGSAPDIAGQDVGNPGVADPVDGVAAGLAWREERCCPLRGSRASDRGGGGDGDRRGQGDARRRRQARHDRGRGCDRGDLAGGVRCFCGSLRFFLRGQNKKRENSPCTVEGPLIDKGFSNRVTTTFRAAITLTRRAKHWQDAMVTPIGKRPVCVPLVNARRPLRERRMG
ncbi:hypothetical protein ACVW1A_005111 [Bradyrhizobium sp. LB1.3]